jgi:hypothetical protein
MPKLTMSLSRAALAALALLAAGCGARLSGTYADESGLGRLEFKDDGTAYMTTFGGTIACTYEVDGEHVILTGPNGSQVLTLTGDRLDGGLGFSFVKR